MLGEGVLSAQQNSGLLLCWSSKFFEINFYYSYENFSLYFRDLVGIPGVLGMENGLLEREGKGSGGSREESILVLLITSHFQLVIFEQCTAS